MYYGGKGESKQKSWESEKSSDTITEALIGAVFYDAQTHGKKRSGNCHGSLDAITVFPKRLIYKNPAKTFFKKFQKFIWIVPYPSSRNKPDYLLSDHGIHNPGQYQIPGQDPGPALHTHSFP